MMKENDKITFVLIFRYLLESGIPMYHALTIIERTLVRYSNRIREAKRMVNNGYPLFQSLQKAGLLNQFETAIIRIGENTENLLSALKKLEEILIKRNDLNTNLKKSLTYPLIFLFVISFIMIIFKNLIIPAFSKLYLDLGMDLPFAFRILSFLTAIFDIKVLIFILINIAVLGFIVNKLLKDNIKNFFKYIFLVPMLGPIFYHSYVSLVLSLWAASLESGLTFSLTFKVLKEETIEPFSTFFSRLYKKIETGELYEIPNYGSVFKSVYVKQMNVGLETGELPFTLRKLSELADIEANTALDTFNRIIEPSMSILAGVITAVLSLSIFSPIINLIRGIQ